MLLGALAALGMMFFMPELMAQNTLPLPGSGSYSGSIVANNRIANAVGTSDLKPAIYSIFSKENLTTVNIIIGIVAILYFVMLGIRFIVSEGKEDFIKNSQKEFGYIILGLIVVSIAQIAAFLVFNPDTQVNNSFLVNQNVTNLVEQKAMEIKLLIQIVIGGIALLSLVSTGYVLISSEGKEESWEKEKQLLKNFLLAVVMILGAEILVRGVFFLPGANREAITNQGVLIGIREIVGLVNTLLTITAAAALIMMVFASLYFVLSLGDEERTNRAKNIIISCVIALIVIFSAYSLVRFFF